MATTPTMLGNVPPFVLNDGQRELIDGVRTVEAKTMLLQVYHQAWCFKHRQVVGVFNSLDPARFTREWNARQAEFLSDAWEAYLGSEYAEAAE